MNIRRILFCVVSCAVIGAIVVPSATAAVPGTSAWHVQGARDQGPARAHRMSMAFVLTPRHAAALKALATSSHRALTPKQFLVRFAPAKRTVRSVRTWAKANNMKVSSVSGNRLIVRLTGSSRSIAQALHTRFDTFSSSSTGTFSQITRRARLPQAFAGKVSAVLGLSNLGRLATPHPATRSATGLSKVLGSAKNLLGTGALALPSLSYPADYTPQDFWKMYDAPSAQTGSGQQLAIITEGDLSQPKKDLATFEQKFGLPAVTWNQINVGTPTSDTSGDDEWDLDSQYSTGFAPGVSQLDVYVGPSLSDSDILTTINRWITDDTSKQGSFSAGECELLAYAAGFTSGLDTVLEAGAAQGQTMFFSSGDTGSQCPAIVGVNGVPVGIPGVSYPASSPYGIGVGGTSVLSPTGPTEITWYAAGGGSSLLEPTPSFQSGTKVGGVVPLVRRGVPDVSLDADPESGYQVVVDGTVETIGGTSASTPSWQGIWARVQGAHSGSLGFAGPVLYTTEPASAYHDVTLGTNGLYVAHPGWDYTTGRGTADIAKLISGA
jgi:subtilase family serine protease